MLLLWCCLVFVNIILYFQKEFSEYIFDRLLWEALSLLGIENMCFFKLAVEINSIIQGLINNFWNSLLFCTRLFSLIWKHYCSFVRLQSQWISAVSKHFLDFCSSLPKILSSSICWIELLVIFGFKQQIYYICYICYNHLNNKDINKTSKVIFLSRFYLLLS